MKPHSLRKPERITRKEEFDELIQKGRRIVKEALLVHFLRKRNRLSRAGFLVGKRIGGAAVRNRLKRRLKESYRRNKDAVGGEFDLLIRARSSLVNSSYGDIERTLLEVGKELRSLQGLEGRSKKIPGLH